MFLYTFMPISSIDDAIMGVGAVANIIYSLMGMYFINNS